MSSKAITSKSQMVKENHAIVGIVLAILLTMEPWSYLLP